MDSKNNTIRLLSVQHKNVIDIIKRDGFCFSKKEFIEKKYEESAKIFLTAYSWLAKEGVKYVQKPQGAEFPYWAFENENDFEKNGDILVLEVPLDECILFDVFDWNKILKLEYLAESKDEEKQFKDRIKNMGINHESQIMLTNFYPELKKEIENSWQNLFRHHNEFIEGKRPIITVQAALWQIKESWIRQIKSFD